MKRIWIVLSLMVLTGVTQAASISASTGEKTFKTFSSLLSQDFEAGEKLLRVYMEDSMGCSQVRMKLNILKEDGLFTNGVFVVGLTADCNSRIRHLKLDFDSLCSRKNQGEVALFIQYQKDGRSVSKRFIVENSQSCQE